MMKKNRSAVHKTESVFRQEKDCIQGGGRYLSIIQPAVTKHEEELGAGAGAPAPTPIRWSFPFPWSIPAWESLLAEDRLYPLIQGMVWGVKKAGS
jgi:hypothetical protein